MDLKQIGDRIQLKRKSRKLSQKELADYIGKSSQMISNYEQGASEVGLKELKLIAEALGCSVAYLLGEESTTEKLPSKPVDGGKFGNEVWEKIIAEKDKIIQQQGLFIQHLLGKSEGDLSTALDGRAKKLETLETENFLEEAA